MKDLLDGSDVGYAMICYYQERMSYGSDKINLGLQTLFGEKSKQAVFKCDKSGSNIAYGRMDAGYCMG